MGDDPTCITFPRYISGEELEKLFSFITQKLPVSITYKFCKEGSTRGGKKEESLRSFLEGTIYDLTVLGCWYEKFNCVPFDYGAENFKKQNFHALHFDNRLANYAPHPKTLNLWDDVRRVISDYFKNEIK